MYSIHIVLFFLEDGENFIVGLSGDYVLDFFLIIIMFQLLNTNNTGQKIEVFFPFIYYVFLTLLSSNIVGLFPYNGAIAAALAFTFVISISCVLGLAIISIVSFSRKVLSPFYQTGAPKFLLKFLILIELMSYLARLISLPTRLFANLISGHILIKILLGFSTTLLTSKPVFKILFILPWIAFSLVLCLEFLVGFLQGYAFVFLLLFYLLQAIGLGI